jgi:alkaline phosphatase D
MLSLTIGLSVLGCEPSGIETLPATSPFLVPSRMEQGVAAGDVAAHSAVLWARTVAPTTLRFEWQEEGASSSAPHWTEVQTRQADDFTAVVTIEGLRPNTVYRYAVRPGAEQETTSQSSSSDAHGRFRTPPEAAQGAAVRFAWSADLGGQGHCRQGEAGYAILDRVVEAQPAFGILLGDLIYADDRCPSPPNAPGADFVATTLDEFRAKHRYQRGAMALQRFLAAVPVLVTWDDHEIRNNFSGPHEPLMAVGRQALLEYWPIRRAASEPGRLYRSLRWGRTVEVFLLDTRQYRDSDAMADGPQKTMLGAEQRRWLLEGMTQSSAVWKIIATTVPLSVAKAGTLKIPGNDSWARGGDGTGFRNELAGIVQTLLDRHVRNVLWIAADVHYAKVHQYDPNEDGTPDFYEVVCGPLAAAFGKLVDAEPYFKPKTLFSASGFSSFGLVSADDTKAAVEIRDDTGAVRFQATFPAR